LIIIPIWLFGLCITAFYTYNATAAIFKISDAKKDLNSYYQAKAEYMKDPKHLLERYDSGFTNTRDEYAEQQEREINDLQDDELYGIYAIIIYIATCFIIPWVILRLTFWIIDADKERVESST
jgi:hypothetical protein